MNGVGPFKPWFSPHRSWIDRPTASKTNHVPAVQTGHTQCSMGLCVWSCRQLQQPWKIWPGMLCGKCGNRKIFPRFHIGGESSGANGSNFPQMPRLPHSKTCSVVLGIILCLFIFTSYIAFHSMSSAITCRYAFCIAGINLDEPMRTLGTSTRNV